MTNTQGQASRAKRSRILNSIFARTPRDTAASSERQPLESRLESTTQRQPAQSAAPAGWRDVTARLSRETMAEGICARFFTAGRTAKVSPEAEFMTAGQRLQALSAEVEPASLGQQNLSALLVTPVRGAQIGHADGTDAQQEDCVTAEAA